jgi:hypothetical protein
VVVLEPDAPWRLRKCISEVLRKHRLPAAPQYFDEDYTGAVVFYRRRRRPPIWEPTDRPLPLLEHTHAFLRGATGLGEELGFGVRSLLRFGKLADLDRTVQLDGHISKVSGSDYSFDANLLVGPTITHGPVTAGLLAGVGASRVGDRLETAFQIPVQVTFAYSGEKLRGLAWARAIFVPRDEARSAPSYALFGGDETEFGFGARVPARSHGGVFLGISIGQVLEQHRVALLMGVSLDSFAPR